MRLINSSFGTIVQLAQFFEIVWKNKSGFDLLTSSLVSLSGGHSVSYLITLVSNEVPVDTNSVLQNAEKQIMKVINSSFGVDILSASSFLDASGKLIKLTSESLQDRPSGITCFHFYCRFDPTQEDACIQ